MQNNTHFQNYAVWVNEQGLKSRMPKWTWNGKALVSDYGIEHKISFTETKR